MGKLKSIALPDGDCLIPQADVAKRLMITIETLSKLEAAGFPPVVRLQDNRGPKFFRQSLVER